MKKLILLLLIGITSNAQYNYQQISLTNSYPIYSGEYINYSDNYNNFDYKNTIDIYGTILTPLKANTDYGAYLEYEYSYKYNNYNNYYYTNKIGQGVIKDITGSYYVIDLYKQNY